MIKLVLLSLFSFGLDSPQDSNHPGSMVYELDYQKKTLSCEGQRDVVAFLPSVFDESTTPTIVFGHGQALNLSHYEESFKHFAKKGVALIFPDYSTGFFDQDWERMAKDYVDQTHCVLEKEGLNKNLLVFSGHSKGAYVSAVATGVSYRDNLAAKPKSLVALNPAGFDASVLPFVPNSVEMTVVFSDQDRIVDKEISESLYEFSSSLKKQFILLKSYPKTPSNDEVEAIHMWPLNRPFLLFGGGPIGPFHYYGMWKWLLGAAEDVSLGGEGVNAYLYGPFAGDKGPVDLKDDIVKSW